MERTGRAPGVLAGVKGGSVPIAFVAGGKSFGAALSGGFFPGFTRDTSLGGFCLVGVDLREEWDPCCGRRGIE